MEVWLFKVAAATVAAAVAVEATVVDAVLGHSYSLSAWSVSVI